MPEYQVPERGRKENGKNRISFGRVLLVMGLLWLGARLINAVWRVNTPLGQVWGKGSKNKNHLSHVLMVLGLVWVFTCILDAASQKTAKNPAPWDEVRLMFIWYFGLVTVAGVCAVAISASRKRKPKKFSDGQARWFQDKGGYTQAGLVLSLGVTGLAAFSQAVLQSTADPTKTAFTLCGVNVATISVFATYVLFILCSIIILLWWQSNRIFPVFEIFTTSLIRLIAGVILTPYLLAAFIMISNAFEWSIPLLLEAFVLAGGSVTLGFLTHGVWIGISEPIKNHAANVKTPRELEVERKVEREKNKRKKKKAKRDVGKRRNWRSVQ